MGKRKVMTRNGSENEKLLMQEGRQPTAGPRRSSFHKFNTANYQGRDIGQMIAKQGS